MKPAPSFRLTAAFAAVVALTGCGGGGGGGVVPPPTVPAYVPLLTTGVAKTSPLSGVALVSTGGGGYDVVALSGTLDHRGTGTVNLTDGASRVLTNADGIADGISQSGGTTLQLATGVAGTYQYARLFNFFNATVSGPAIVGIPTATADIATVNNASVVYSGGSTVNYASLAGGSNQTSGASNIAVNFVSGSLQVTLSGLGGGATPFDRIVISGVTLTADRTGFSGGTVTVLNGATDVTNSVIGAGAGSDHAGGFFGPPNALGRPAEVGGLVVMVGGQGELFGGYLGQVQP